MLVARLCPTLCDLVDRSPPGYSRALEWVAISSSRGSCRPRNRTRVSCFAGDFFPSWATREPHLKVQLCSETRKIWDSILKTSDVGIRVWWEPLCVWKRHPSLVSGQVRSVIRDKSFGLKAARTPRGKKEMVGGQGSLACNIPRGRKDSDRTSQLADNNNSNDHPSPSHMWRIPSRLRNPAILPPVLGETQYKFHFRLLYNQWQRADLRTCAPSSPPKRWVSGH